jgi:hypothetical protein
MVFLILWMLLSAAIFVSGIFARNAMIMALGVVAALPGAAMIVGRMGHAFHG